LEERFIVRDCLENVPISSDIPNSPLTQTSAAQPENVTAWFVNELLEPSFHFVIGQESHVTGMSYGKTVPVPEQRGPGLKESCENVKFKN